MTDDVFHAGAKLTWIESIVRDRRTTPFDRMVAVALSSFASVDRIVRKASQERIARFVGGTERGVRGSIKRLRDLGHLEPLPVDGAAFGREHVTEYRLLTPPQTRNGETRNGDAQKAERKDTKLGTAVPPYPLRIRKESFAHADARGGGPQGERWLDRCWQAIKERLGASEHFGEDKVEAWLSKLGVASITDGEVIMTAPSKFIAQRLAIDHAETLLREWQAVDATIRRVTFKRVLPQSVAVEGAPNKAPKLISIRDRLKAKYNAG